MERNSRATKIAHEVAARSTSSPCRARARAAARSTRPRSSRPPRCTCVRQQHDDVADQEEQRLEDEGEVVDHVARRRTSSGVSSPIDRQRDDRDQRGEQTETGHRRRDPLAALSATNRSSDAARRRCTTARIDLGREGVVVDGRRGERPRPGRRALTARVSLRGLRRPTARGHGGIDDAGTAGCG